MVRPKRQWVDRHVAPHDDLSDAINELEDEGYTVSCTPLLDGDARLHWAILGWREPK